MEKRPGMVVMCGKVCKLFSIERDRDRESIEAETKIDNPNVERYKA